MKQTIKELRERIADLEREVEYYKGIAATYRGALGDVRANTILLPFFENRRDRRKDLRREDWVGNWGHIQESRQP